MVFLYVKIVVNSQREKARSMKQSGVNKAEIALVLDVHRNTVSNWLNS